ncbi:MAG TPA: TonB family protein [Candidatus Latescibacteria bacterium]|nr:TonB family protein [Candidatus Latescibacterota bacterium]
MRTSDRTTLRPLHTAGLLSLAGHLLLTWVLYRTPVEVRPEAPEVVELHLGRVAVEGWERGGTIWEGGRPGSEVEVEPPSLTAPAQERLPLLPPAVPPVGVQLSPARKVVIPDIGERRYFLGREVEVGPPVGVGAETAQVGEEAEPDFRITGEVKDRVILYKVLPRYPPEVQSEAVITLWFTVRPDGTVGEVHPVRKGEPRLENEAVAALKQWRFNSLSPDAGDQTGEITFYYRLR